MRLIIASLLALAATLTQAQQSSLVDVSGSIAYRQRIALPPDAIVVVQVVDTSRADAPRLLAEKRYGLEGAQVPVPFVLTVDRDLVAPGARIVVRASIERGKKLLFTTDRIYPVLTNDQPARADLVLVMAGGRRAP